ncbi:SGNH/GDSL hydrolase family protein [Paenibacillus ginsengihumi]|uniref:SGNH/GDSL hydrolase family protein n=1 Tax=Paenibacillus ginsengihumi TaxID=431596 RepID=UPI000368DD32|nr:SGNH/GDSL hydrolase family protein [Paenibacillus ginsengihumi]
MLLEQNDKLVMIGDSITDCGRKHPVGEGRNEDWGKGYVSQVHSLLHSFYPELGIRVVNMGISGNRVRDLKNRWQTDVLDLQPQWVSIMIGINDVWRQFDQPLQTEIHVYPDEYRETLGELVERTLPRVKGIVLMTPFYIEPNKNDAMRRMMDSYGQIVKETAERHGTVFVDTQEAIDRLLAHLYPATLAWDRVHPNAIGHMTLARAFLNGIGFDWSR